jgi:hypothetical protein
VQFTVPFEQEPEQPLDLAAYVTDRSTGEVVATTPIRDGRFQLDVEAARTANLSISIAPVRPDLGDELPTSAQLARLRAYEPVFTFEPGRRVYELKPIPAHLSLLWWLCFCRVRGRVVKPDTSGGVTVDRPICHARVHICEVDPIWIVLDRLPDPDVFRLRDQLLEVIDRPIPVPPEPPWPVGPQPRPDPIGPIDFAPVEVLDVALEDAPLPARLEAGSPPGAAAFAATAAGPSARSLSAQLPVEARLGLISPSAQSVRRALIDNVILIRPWLCWWRWLSPWWWRCDERAVVETDESGRFDVTVWYLCNDRPDLYFWVEWFIDGAWTTVYAPWRPCGTYWDFDCTSDVTIRVTDPRVPYCDGHDSAEGKVVVVKSIGNAVSISEILGSAADTREGLTVGEGIGGLDSPFAGTLELRADFGDALFASGVQKYQWSYRQITDAAGKSASDSWHVMTRLVVRHYRDQTNPPIDLPYKLGPNSNNFFEVWNPTTSTSPAGNHNWPVDDAHEDLVSGFFETGSLDPSLSYQPDDAKAGRYELKLELFHADNSLVDWTAENIGLFEANVPAPFGANPVTTQQSPNEHRILDPNNNHTLGFRLVLHVDNSRCEAAIFDVTSGGNASGPCGFIDYDKNANPPATAHVSFLARHVHDFAAFWFQVFKGSSGEVAPASVDPWAPTGVTPANSFNRDASWIWAQDIPVDTLINANTQCPDGRAAFAEMMYVASSATDGWNRASWLDAGATPKAFALNPKPKPNP